MILESDASQYGIGPATLHRFPDDDRPSVYAVSAYVVSATEIGNFQKPHIGQGTIADTE